MSEAESEADAFIYLVSHDLRSSVRALSELPVWIEEDLAETGVELPEAVQSSIALMHRHTGRLDNMLADLLAYSRVGRKQETADVVFEKVFEEAKAKLPGAARFDITTHFNHLGARMGVQDAATLFFSIMENVVKHAGDAAGRMMVSAKQKAGVLTLELHDDGIGVAPELYQRAIAPMVTLRSRDEIEGSGMGLAIAGKIAAHYGGKLALSPSRFGQGLCVSVTIHPSK